MILLRTTSHRTITYHSQANEVSQTFQNRPESVFVRYMIYDIWVHAKKMS